MEAKATFAGGCFWCMQPPFDKVEGVISTTVGYVGGHLSNPTYEQVSSGETGHAEAIQVLFDPEKVSYQKLLDIFWHTIDPTTRDQQFCDIGHQYRTAIFYHDEIQHRLAKQSKEDLIKSHRFESVVTEIIPATNFYPAEEYHQDYYKTNPYRYKIYHYMSGREERLSEMWKNEKGESPKIGSQMRAMVLEKIGAPLVLKDIPLPKPEKGQIRIQVTACGVCRTDLHLVDGELPNPRLPIVPGHQVVGIVDQVGEGVENVHVGERKGIPWLWKTCGICPYCLSDRENLCDNGIFTGYQVNGGFAEYCIAHPDYCFSLPEKYSDLHAAPLLCGGLIGYRSYRMAGNFKRIGFYGFGASAHILIQLACYQNKEVYVFTRPGDTKTQQFAKSRGAVWAGGSDQLPPHLLEAAILFAPVGALVPQALKALEKGGTVVCAGIHMSDISTFPYSILWEERTVRSVANLTRQDAVDFLSLASEIPIQTEIATYELPQVNLALDDLRHGRFSGTAVIIRDKGTLGT